MPPPGAPAAAGAQAQTEGGMSVRYSTYLLSGAEDGTLLMALSIAYD